MHLLSSFVVPRPFVITLVLLVFLRKQAQLLRSRAQEVGACLFCKEAGLLLRGRRIAALCAGASVKQARAGFAWMRKASLPTVSNEHIYGHSGQHTPTHLDLLVAQ